MQFAVHFMKLGALAGIVSIASAAEAYDPTSNAYRYFGSSANKLNPLIFQNEQLKLSTAQSNAISEVLRRYHSDPSPNCNAFGLAYVDMDGGYGVEGFTTYGLSYFTAKTKFDLHQSRMNARSIQGQNMVPIGCQPSVGVWFHTGSCYLKKKSDAKCEAWNNPTFAVVVAGKDAPSNLDNIGTEIAEAMGMREGYNKLGLSWDVQTVVIPAEVPFNYMNVLYLPKNTPAGRKSAFTHRLGRMNQIPSLSEYPHIVNSADNNNNGITAEEIVLPESPLQTPAYLMSALQTPETASSAMDLPASEPAGSWDNPTPEEQSGTNYFIWFLSYVYAIIAYAFAATLIGIPITILLLILHGYIFPAGYIPTLAIALTPGPLSTFIGPVGSTALLIGSGLLAGRTIYNYAKDKGYTVASQVEEEEEQRAPLV